MEIITKDEFELLVGERRKDAKRTGESQFVEFKRSEFMSDTEKMAKWMAAFANTQGGHLLIGVCDDGKLEGMKENKQDQSHIISIARDKCLPPLIPEVRVYNSTNGDAYDIHLRRFSVIPHGVKHKSDLKYFIRIGDTVREATSMEIKMLFESKEQESIGKPNLELNLIDKEDKDFNDLTVGPIFVIEKKITNEFMRQSLITMNRFQSIWGTSLSVLSSAFSDEDLGIKKDLVEIKIRLSNTGEKVAEGIKIWLQFPDSCELFEYKENILELQHKSRTSGGIHLDQKIKTNCSAWIDRLGNDLVYSFFHPIYVRFPKKDDEYMIHAQISQDNFPIKLFEFKVKVKPKYEEIGVL